MKKLIRLTESDLHRIISESVNEIYSGDLDKAVGGSPVINQSHDAFIDHYTDHNGKRAEYRRETPFEMKKMLSMKQ